MKVLVTYKNGKQEEYIRTGCFESDGLIDCKNIIFYVEHKKIKIPKKIIESVKIYDF